MKTPNYTGFDLLVFLMAGLISLVWSVVNTLLFTFKGSTEGVLNFAAFYGVMIGFYKVGISSGRSEASDRSRTESTHDESDGPEGSQ